ncbi:MAG: Gfo/Idh/MocA family oxidoreductase [Deltaproteobacteria bacterium]|nr:Gfo/Idh/MocA family oxidoreductase [Deltaproteobacteria bacterium]
MLHIAVLGLGWWGSKLLRNLSANPQVSKISGCDPWAARREEMKSYPNVVLYEDPSRVLEMPDVVGVVIATPPPTHFELAKAAFAAGKHVLMTKPPTQTLTELEILVEMADRDHFVFMMDSTFVYSDPVREIRHLLDKELFPEIGFIQSLRYGNDLRMHNIARLRTTMLDQGTDVIRDLFFHDAAILTYLFPNEVFAPVAVHRLYGISGTCCDTAMIRLESQRFPIHVGLSWTLPERRRELLIADGRQQLIFDDLDPEKKLTLFKFEEKTETALPHGAGEPLANVVDHFIMCIRERQRPLTDGGFMLKVMELFESVLQFKQ